MEIENHRSSILKYLYKVWKDFWVFVFAPILGACIAAVSKVIDEKNRPIEVEEKAIRLEQLDHGESMM